MKNQFNTSRNTSTSFAADVASVHMALVYVPPIAPLKGVTNHFENCNKSSSFKP